MVWSIALGATLSSCAAIAFAHTTTRAHPWSGARRWWWLAAAPGAGAAPVLSGLPAGLALPMAVAAGLLVVVAVVDARQQRIPNAATAPLLLLVLALVLVWGLARDDLPLVGRALLGGGAWLVAYALPALCGACGFGDAKLAPTLGVLTATVSPQAAVLGYFLAYLLAAPGAARSLIRRRRAGARHDGGQLAFGPYLVTGALLAIALAP